MSSQEYERIVRQWVDEGWNQGNFRVVDEYFALDYVLHVPGQPPTVGPEPFKAFVASYRAGFPDFTVTIEDLFSSDDRVAWRFTCRGTHRGELIGIPPTGRSVVVEGVVISRFENGRWVEDWGNWDALGMLQQLGVVPVPEATTAQ